MKTLILYVFHEINNRVYYFINNGIFESEYYTFLIICNNKNIEFDCPSYVKILKRDNNGYDFGGWSDGLLTDDLYKNYDRFIFINSSAIGPFTPPYYSGNWCDIFNRGITDKTKLYGTTISTIDYLNPNTNSSYQTISHIQSWTFCTDRIGLDLLIEKGIFSNTNYVKIYRDAIYQKEILMSRLIINNGWNIGCLLKYYDNVDFSSKNIMSSNVLPLGDVAFQGEYFKGNVQPYEVIFMKGNRNYDKKWLDVYYRKDVLKNTINRAIYGANEKYNDVTDIVNSLVGRTFKISNEYFGDSNYGKYKHLIILTRENDIVVSWEENFYCNEPITDIFLKSYYQKLLEKK